MLSGIIPNVFILIGNNSTVLVLIPFIKSDIIPTGLFGADIANVQVGDDVAVFGAGPVGYFAVLICFLRGVTSRLYHEYAK